MSIDNINKDTTVTGNKRLTSGDLRSMFLRSNVLLASANFERVQNLGICYIMIPAIKRLYAPGPERTEALKRHLEWFNTQPYCASPILGVAAAMEEEKANGAQIEGNSISGVKIGLMGPFAGVGDPIFWGTIRPVLAALGGVAGINRKHPGSNHFFCIIQRDPSGTEILRIELWIPERKRNP